MNLIVYRNAKHILIKAISKAIGVKMMKMGHDGHSQESIHLRAPVSSFCAATRGTGAKMKPYLPGREGGREGGRRKGGGGKGGRGEGRREG